MKYFTAETNWEDNETHVVVDVSITVSCPIGIVADERVLKDACERASDYIFDEGLNDE